MAHATSSPTGTHKSAVRTKVSENNNGPLGLIVAAVVILGLLFIAFGVKRVIKNSTNKANTEVWVTVYQDMGGGSYTERFRGKVPFEAPINFKPRFHPTGPVALELPSSERVNVWFRRYICAGPWNLEGVEWSEGVVRFREGKAKYCNLSIAMQKATQ